MNGYLFVALAAAIATACSQGEQGVSQAQTGDPVIVLSEGACLGTCPIYDMTLHPGGEYVLNGQRFVKATGVSEGDLGKPAWTKAVGILEDAGFWMLQPDQTMSTIRDCHTDAPTAKVTWRTEEGKEKTVTYNAGCGVEEMQNLIRSLRGALHFKDLVWTDEKFDPSGRH
jgi:hypothetical protein